MFNQRTPAGDTCKYEGAFIVTVIVVESEIGDSNLNPRQVCWRFTSH